MKRCVYIATIAMIVLAMTASTAFASVCVTPRCDRTMGGGVATPSGAMMTGHTGMQSMVTDRASGGPSIQTPCDMDRGHRSSDLSVPSSSPEKPSPAIGVQAPAIPAAVGTMAVAAVAHADARGAPHLSAVLRV